MPGTVFSSNDLHFENPTPSNFQFTPQTNSPEVYVGQAGTRFGFGYENNRQAVFNSGGTLLPQSERNQLYSQGKSSGQSGNMAGIAASAAISAVSSDSFASTNPLSIGYWTSVLDPNSSRNMGVKNLELQKSALAQDQKQFDSTLSFNREQWQREWSAATTAGLYSPAQFGVTSSDSMVGKLKSNGKTLYQPRVPKNSFRNY